MAFAHRPQSCPARSSSSSRAAARSARIRRASIRRCTTRNRTRLGHRHVDRRDQRARSSRATRRRRGSRASPSSGNASPSGTPRLSTDSASAGCATSASSRTAFPRSSHPIQRALFGLHARVGLEQARSIRHGPLRETLYALVDFDYLNRRGMRLTVGAVNVCSGRCATSTTATRRWTSTTSWRPARFRRPFRRCGSTASPTGTAASTRTRRSKPCSTTSRAAIR